MLDNFSPAPPAPPALLTPLALFPLLPAKMTLTSVGG